MTPLSSSTWASALSSNIKHFPKWKKVAGEQEVSSWEPNEDEREGQKEIFLSDYGLMSTSPHVVIVDYPILLVHSCILLSPVSHSHTCCVYRVPVQCMFKIIYISTPRPPRTHTHSHTRSVVSLVAETWKTIGKTNCETDVFFCGDMLKPSQIWRRTSSTLHTWHTSTD